jgi:hypothetical protein
MALYYANNAVSLSSPDSKRHLGRPRGLIMTKDAISQLFFESCVHAIYLPPERKIIKIIK